MIKPTFSPPYSGMVPGRSSAFRGLVLLATPLLLAACATGRAEPNATETSRSGNAPALSCPVGFPTEAESADWEARVDAARAMTDPDQQRDAMLALVREALDGAGMDVRVAGNSSPGRLDPSDYQPSPVVNFDINLDAKRGTDAASYFPVGDTPYVVLGPGSLVTRGPAFTREYAEHELYHARHHVGDSRPRADRELEVWTHVFVSSFHEKFPYKIRWSPLFSNYEDASRIEQQLTLSKLTEYYNNPPGPPITAGCATEVRVAFMEWLERRTEDERTSSSQLVQDLLGGIQPTGPGAGR